MTRSSDTLEELVIIGAGVAGLSLARELAARGQRPLLLERSQRVGGRCATKHVQGQAVDHGVSTLHGRSAPFRGALDALGGAGLTPLQDWPLHVLGAGTPCQPQGFTWHAHRLALAEGVRAFPEHMARGLDVRHRANVEGLRPAEGALSILLEGGELLQARRVVVTLPAPQAAALVVPLAEGDAAREIGALAHLLGRIHLLPCLTLVVGYTDRPTDGGWHLMLPAGASPIHSLINDGAKRSAQTPATLVIQGSAPFSRRSLQREPEQSEAWSAELLAAAAELLDDWVLRPSWQVSHRWRYARVQRGDELSRPVLLSMPGGAELGLCGEAFNPAGGVEGAYLSGLELARRLTADQAAA